MPRGWQPEGLADTDLYGAAMICVIPQGRASGAFDKQYLVEQDVEDPIIVGYSRRVNDMHHATEDDDGDAPESGQLWTGVWPLRESVSEPDRVTRFRAFDTASPAKRNPVSIRTLSRPHVSNTDNARNVRPSASCSWPKSMRHRSIAAIG